MAKKKLLIEKRKVLNDIIAREFDLQELRLFSIYLAKINARDPSTRLVRLPLKQFYKSLDALQTVRINYLKTVTHNLLSKVVCFNDTTGGYQQFQLFKECRVFQDTNGQWYFEIDAHDKALPLMFDFKKDYFTYELWNVMNLESVNQFRMYEILKQNEWCGERVISLTDLKALLGIDKKEYPRWNNFRRWVLDACQKALKEKTDITFTYEPYIRSGRGGSIQSLRFTINKNTEYRLSFDYFVCDESLENIMGPEQPMIPVLDVTALDFITEPITKTDKQSILHAADNDVGIVKAAYDMAKQQGGINSLTAWLIDMVKKIRNGEVNLPVKVARKNRFNNFTGHGYDYAELERLDLEQLMAGSKETDEAE